MASPADVLITRLAGPRKARQTAAGSNLAAAVDGLMEFVILAVASWTLIYDIGAVTNLGTPWLLALWALSLAAIGVGLARLGWTPAQAPAAPVAGVRWLAAVAAWRKPLGMASVALGAAAGLAAGLHTVGLSWNWTWVLGVPAVAATLTWLLLPDAEAGPGSGAPSPASARVAAPGGSLLALGTAAAAAIFSLYIVRPDADDTYFVNRAVWVAQHGRIPVKKDVIFTNGTVNHISAETPVSSIEGLIGALARLFGMQAATLTYLIALPVFVFVAVWAVWLLIRRWAPDRYVLCFVAAMLYLAWSGTSPASFGSFHLVRMWQGKGAFVSLMVPLLYVYLTQWAECRSRRSLLIVAAAGIAATGLTSSAALVVPLIVAAVAVPLLLARQVRAALGTLLAAAYPVLAGLAVAVFSPVHLPHSPMAPATVWAWVLLAGMLGGIGGVALWTAPHLVRRGVPALITCGVAGVVTVLMLPGVLTMIGNATGTNAVTWRIMWVVPGPVLVGLLATIPVPLAARLRSAGPWITAVPATALCALILATGLPVWSYQNVHARIADRPSWKYDPLSLSLAAKALRADHQPGYLLSTGRVMGAIPLLTSRILAVNPRTYYLEHLPVSAQFISDRLLLSRVAGQTSPMPAESAFRAALSRVPVGFACVWRHNTAGLRLLEQAGFTPARHFGTFDCLRRLALPAACVAA